MRLKACPKCQGDLVYHQDYYGTFWTCIQCGHLQDEVPSRGPKPAPTRTTCEAGHPYTEDTEGIGREGERRCLTCAREHNREYYRRRHPSPRAVGRPRKGATEGAMKLTEVENG